jgi:DNA-binding NtrC family response regulator
MKMSSERKKILIVDEAGFSRICSAILEQEGHGTNACSDLRDIEASANYQDIGLVITSYPYGATLFDKLREMKIPTIILSDHLSKDLVTSLEKLGKPLSHCMIKPLDYTKFRTLVNQVMSENTRNTSPQYNENAGGTAPVTH